MSKRSKRQLAPLLMAVNVLAIACGGGGDGTQPPPGDVITVSKTTAGSGDAQTGTVGQPLASPIQVVVTENGSPAAGATVNWSTTTAGGTLTPASGATNADGVASSSWLLGTVSGAQTAGATVSGASGSPVTFTATAAAAAAATVAKAGGDGQTGEINRQLALPVQARVTDQFGNAVGGASLNWTATGAATSAPTAVSDAAGISQVNVTLGGTAGPITIVAESNVLTGSPLTFSATATAPLPTPTSINVSVRNDNFLSVRNGTVNPAVDTVLAGGTVTWGWAPTASNPHSVTSTGSPSFQGQAAATQPPPFTVIFSTPGTYSYYCTVHGAPTSGMRGRIVVQ